MRGLDVMYLHIKAVQVHSVERNLELEVAKQTEHRCGHPLSITGLVARSYGDNMNSYIACFG
jgi:hypothetical protein